MKKVNIKTEKLHALYTLMGAAKYSKMSDADKIRAWKIARRMKPVATAFEEESRDAAEKLRPTDDFNERLRKAQHYEQHRDGMSEEEYKTFLNEFQHYNKLVADAVSEIAARPVELDFEPLGEEAFG